MKKNVKPVAESAAQSVVVEKVVAGQLTDLKLVAPDRFLLDMTTKLGEHTQLLISASRQVASGFIDIGKELVALRDDKGVLSACGYADIYDYSEKVLVFKRTSTKNFISVFERFGDQLSYNGKYRDYSFTQLVELLPVKDNIEDYKPDMTVQAIRDQKLLEKVKVESRTYDDYLRKAFLLCGSFLSGAVVDDKIHGDYAHDDSKNVSGSFLFDGVSYPATFDVGFNKGQGEFVCRNDFWVGKTSAYVWVSAKTPAAFSEKAAAELRKVLKERAEKKSGKGSEKAKKEKPDWQLWYELPSSCKKGSFTPEGFRNPSLHSFFASAAYCDEGLADASSYPYSKLVRVVNTLEVVDGKLTGKAVDVVYLFADEKGKIASYHGSGDVSGLIAFLDAWCAGQIAAGKGVVSKKS
jgi:hypothetical protein